MPGQLADFGARRQRARERMRGRRNRVTGLERRITRFAYAAECVARRVAHSVCKENSSSSTRALKRDQRVRVAPDRRAPAKQGETGGKRTPRQFASVDVLRLMPGVTA